MINNEEKIEYIRRFGNATSIGLLHPLCKVFKDPSIDGIIGYRDEYNCAVALGDPLCQPKDREMIAQRFNDFCKSQKKSSVYMMTSESFTLWTVRSFNAKAFQIGHEIIIDPAIDARTLSGMYPHHLRQKYNHAIVNNVSVCEYTGNNTDIELTLTGIAAQWLHHRSGPQIYLLPLDIFAHRSSKRWFYASQNGTIIGFLMLNKIASDGWVLSGSIMCVPQAPKSTTEFLMLFVLETLRKEGAQFFSTGSTVSTDVTSIQGFGKIYEFLIHTAMKSVGKLFKMDERQRYWKKFLPKKKEPSFVSFITGVGIKEVRAILRTFNVNM